MKLVDAAKERNINLRQSYERVGKKAFIKHGRYLHARQMKRDKKERKKLKTYLGRTIRDVKRKMPEPDTALLNLLTMAEKIFHQEKADKNGSSKEFVGQNQQICSNLPTYPPAA